MKRLSRLTTSRHGDPERNRCAQTFLLGGEVLGVSFQTEPVAEAMKAF